MDINFDIGKRFNIDGEYYYLAEPAYRIIPNGDPHQYCRCGKCGTKLVSWTKLANCPKCKKECYLT